jgi:hypothetical protein
MFYQQCPSMFNQIKQITLILDIILLWLDVGQEKAVLYATWKYAMHKTYERKRIRNIICLRRYFLQSFMLTKNTYIHLYRIRWNCWRLRIWNYYVLFSLFQEELLMPEMRALPHEFVCLFHFTPFPNSIAVI